PHVGRVARVGRRDDNTDYRPMTVVAPARERPPAAQTKASRDALDDARGRQAGRDLHARVRAPHVLLRLRRKQAEVPRVAAAEREDRAARPADGADVHDAMVERTAIEFIALVTLRLKTTKEAGLLEVLERLVGKPSKPLGMQGACAHRGKQGADAGEIFF